MRRPGGLALRLAALVALALALRLLPWPRVFTIAYVNFQGDAWYHLRRVDTWLAQFPHGLLFDPYIGQYVPIPPLYDFLIATLAIVFGGFPEAGSPVADAMAAIAPAVLGALVVLPVFGLGRLLFDEQVGLWAGALAGLLPGPFLIRSLLGVTDHHVAEVLFSSTALFLAARACQASDAPATRPRSVWASAVLAGIALGAYFLVWSGAVFVVSGFLAWGVWEYTRAFWRGASTRGLSIAVGVPAAIAFALVRLFQPPSLARYDTQWAALALLCGLVLVAEACRLAARSPRAAAAAWTLLLIGGAWAARFDPRLNAVVEEGWSVVFGTGSMSVGETRPLLRMVSDSPSWRPVVELYGTSLVGLLALPFVAWRAVRGPRRGLSLLVFWTVITFVATLGRNRFGYYLVPNLALLLGWLSARLFQASRDGNAAKRVLAATMLLAISAPNALAAWNCTLVNEGVPTTWHQALAWLRKSSEEPYGDPGYYFARYQPPHRVARARVLAWWDYGYWILRIGRRVPIANPTQAGAGPAALALLGGETAETSRLLGEMRVRYVIANDELVFQGGPGGRLVGKFATMADFAGRPLSDYVEVFREAGGGAIWVFHPAYYESLAVHLYLYKGEAVPAEETWVISYRHGKDDAGQPVKQVTESRAFADHEAALGYARSLGETPHVVAGRDPVRTCVPLPKRAGLRLAFESRDAEEHPLRRPSVRIFEYGEPAPSPP